MFSNSTDAHLKYAEIVKMRSTTACRTVEELRKLLSTYGLPKQILMDNGNQFVSKEVTTFTKSNGVEHIKSAPHHPSTNGAVKRLVQTFKKVMRAIECNLMLGA